MVPLTVDELRALLEMRPTSSVGVVDRVARAWFRTLARLWRFGGASNDNEITLFFSGDDAFAAMLQAIDGASTRVWLETYIFEDDSLGVMVRDALSRAAERGVDVVVLYDHFGSSNLDEGFFAPLRHHGARVIAFNPIFVWKRKNPLMLRDHRKILVVDERTAFCGGMNISADYAGPALGNGKFRDTHARVVGSGAGALAGIFEESVVRATGTALVPKPSSTVAEKVKTLSTALTTTLSKGLSTTLSTTLSKAASTKRTEAQRATTTTPSHAAGKSDDEDSLNSAAPSGVMVQILRAEPFRTRRQIQRALRHVVGRSLQRCFLTSPYFLPPRNLIRLMQRAAARGVDVRIMTAGESDVPLMRHASWHIYARLLRHGVRVFELRSSTLHAKTAAIDGIFAMVGSFNLDLWSHNRLLEVSMAMIDTDIAAQIETQFAHDVDGSREVLAADLRARSPIDRLVSWLAYVIVRL